MLGCYRLPDKGWPDLLSEPMVESMDDVDNSRMLSNSPAVPPLPMQQLFNPMDKIGRASCRERV